MAPAQDRDDGPLPASPGSRDRFGRRRTFTGMRTPNLRLLAVTGALTAMAAVSCSNGNGASGEGPGGAPTETGGTTGSRGILDALEPLATGWHASTLAQTA